MDTMKPKTQVKRIQTDLIEQLNKIHPDINISIMELLSKYKQIVTPVTESVTDCNKTVTKDLKTVTKCNNSVTDSSNNVTNKSNSSNSLSIEEFINKMREQIESILIELPKIKGSIMVNATDIIEIQDKLTSLAQLNKWRMY